jgi:hypothetical protein
MQNLDSRGQSSRGFVTLARSELRHFSQRNCRKKQEREPGAATDVSSVLAKKNPRDTSNREDNQCGDSPPAIRSARSPRPCQNNQWRNQRDEKKNVIQVHHFDLGKKRG